MQSLQFYSDQMHELLTRLLDVAIQLRDMSKQVISEEDLAKLQQQQKGLLAELQEVDHQIQENYKHQLDPTRQKEIDSQLHTFQQLNQEFIQNLRANHGLIQFELRSLEDQEDFSYFSHLYKMSPSPNSSKTVEAEESEKS